MKCGDLSFIILIQVTKPGGGFFSCKKPPLAALRAAIHPKNALHRIKCSALFGARPKALPLETATFEKVDETFHFYVYSYFLASFLKAIFSSDQPSLIC